MSDEEIDAYYADESRWEAQWQARQKMLADNAAYFAEHGCLPPKK